MKEILIALCFDDYYALNGAMVLYSIAKNIKRNVKIRAYIIDGGIRKETKEKFKKILRRNLDIVWLNPDLSIFDNLPLSSWTTKVAHSRLLLPYIIQDDIKKIIYLDSDILVVGDLLRLWKIPLNDCFLAAFQDSTYTNVYKKVNSKVLVDAGMNRLSPYFNSGFLMIDVSLWKKYDILRKYIEILGNIGNQFTHCNQDAMNIIFNNKWKQIKKEIQYDNNTHICSLKKMEKITGRISLSILLVKLLDFQNANILKKNYSITMSTVQNGFLKKSLYYGKLKYS